MITISLRKQKKQRRRVAVLTAILFLQNSLFAPLATAGLSGDSTFAIERSPHGVLFPTSESVGAESGHDFFGGEARTGYPIRVAPGVAGLQPSISLQYGSHGTDRASWVGLGWGLGLGSIQRSLREGVPTYDDQVDTFTFAGQNLVEGTPPFFHTRRETFQQIKKTAFGWEVRSKDGSVSRYGQQGGTASGNCSIKNVAGEHFAWLLCEREDVHGNRMTVEYDHTSDVGVPYLKEITYGTAGSLNRSVEFSLEPRPDPTLSYIAGFEQSTTQRLSVINVKVDSELLRRYELVYEQSPNTGRSLLREIREHGSDADSQDPTPPHVTSYEYRFNSISTDTLGWSPVPPTSTWLLPWAVTFTYNPSRFEDGGLRIADLNGDALPDLLREFHDDTYQLNGSYMNNGQGFDPASQEFRLPLKPNSTQRHAFTKALWVPGTYVSTASGTLLVDLNRDGRADMLHLSATHEFSDLDNVQKWETYQHRALNRKSLSAAVWESTYEDWASVDPNDIFQIDTFKGYTFAIDWHVEQLLETNLEGRTVLAELNGDGQVDLVQRFTHDDPYYSPAWSERSYVLNTGNAGTGFSPRSTDRFEVCNDPTPVCEWESLASFRYEFWLDGYYSTNHGIPKHAMRASRQVDLNGDGLTDHLTSHFRFDTTPNITHKVMLNGGTDYVSDNRWIIDPFFLTWDDVGVSRDTGIRFADVNGDGLLDMVIGRLNYYSETLLNTGNPVAPWNRLAVDDPLLPPEAFVELMGEDRGVRFADLNGDGMIDLIRSHDTTRDAWLNKGKVPDLLVRVTNRFGGTTTLGYTPSTQFYSGNPQDPAPQLPMVKQLLTSVVTDDLQGNIGTTTITYEGGLFDAPTREFRGFATSWATEDLGAGETRTTMRTFAQDEGRVGLPLTTEISGTDGSIRRLVTQYTVDVDGAPYVSLPESRETYEQDGTLSRTTLENYTYDAFGNLRTKEEIGEISGAIDVDPADNRVTDIEYAFNSTDYLVDRVARQRVWAGAVGSGDIVRESEFYYDDLPELFDPPSLGDLTKRVDVLGEAGKPDPTTTYGYDSYGNRTSETSPRENAGELAAGLGTTTVEFDPTFHSFVVATVNGLGHRTEYGYTAGPICTAFYQDGFTYPAGSGLMQSEKNPNDLASGSSRQLCYDAFGRVVVDTAPGNLSQKTFVYTDTIGDVRIDEHRLVPVRRTETQFDGFGRPLQIKNFTGPRGEEIVQSRSYDQSGRAASETGPHFEGETGAVTAYEYDALDRTIARFLPSPAGQSRSETTSYAAGLVTSVDPNGNATERLIDAFGNLREVREIGEADGPYVTVYEYDVLNQLTEVTDHEGNETHVTYDLLGRKKSIVDPDTSLSPLPGNETSFAYDANGNATSRTDARGAVVNWTYDALDRRLTEAYGAEAPYLLWYYDTALRGIGLLHLEIAGERYDEVLSYDLLGRPVTTRYSTPGTEADFETTYDPLGQVTSRTYPNGRTIEWVHDANGYLESVKSGPLLYATEIQWDARGRLTHWLGDNGVEDEASYDPETGRLNEIRVEGALLLEHLSYEFDDGDRIFQIDDLRDPQRDRSFGYDTLDRLTQATGPYAAGFGSVSWYYQYTPIGNLACKSSTSPTACTGPDYRIFGNGDHPYYIPDPAHAPTRLTEPGPAGQQWIAGPQYDYSGNLTDYQSLAGSWTYAYNALSQLESATSVASGDVTRFEYDGDGRLALIEEGTGASAVLRHLVYEDFEWGVTDELARIHISIGSTLIATHTESFVQSGGGACGMGAELGLLGPLLFCFGGRGSRRRRRRRSAVAVGTAGAFLTSVVVVPLWVATPPPVGASTPALGVLYYHGDHLGSTTVVTDEVGTLVERTVYRPFGEAVPAVAGGATDAPEFGFTSQRYVDSIDIYDYGARWYHPVLARFIQPDPLVPDPADPQSLNRYSYVRNNPIARVDPTGNAGIDFDMSAFDLTSAFLSGQFGAASAVSLTGLSQGGEAGERFASMEQVQIDDLTRELGGLLIAIEATDRSIQDLQRQRDRHWLDNMIRGRDGLWYYAPSLLIKDPENSISPYIGNPAEAFWRKQDQLMMQINGLNLLNLNRLIRVQDIGGRLIPWHEARQHWARGGFSAPEPEP